MGNTFAKEERLCGLKSIELLLKNGHSKLIFPVRFTWCIVEDTQEFPVKIAFSVPKKRFKRANKRNLLKRRLREAFRLNKHELYDFLKEKGLSLHILVVYVSPELKDFVELETAMKNVFQQIIKSIIKRS